MGTENHHLSIVGMSCEHCRCRVQRALEGVAGVTKVEIDLSSGTANVQAGRGDVSIDALVSAVEKVGYSAGTMSTP
ncbi:MAG: heavy-metal-associated domain-containing protein [Armatimonadota bacterium]